MFWWGFLTGALTLIAGGLIIAPFLFLASVKRLFRSG
jgi:hypothetical protein